MKHNDLRKNLFYFLCKGPLNDILPCVYQVSYWRRHLLQILRLFLISIQVFVSVNVLKTKLKVYIRPNSRVRKLVYSLT